jgi:hypothetical protein
MPTFTNVELTDMMFPYGAAGGNAVQVQILYREQFPHSSIQERKIVTETIVR